MITFATMPARLACARRTTAYRLRFAKLSGGDADAAMANAVFALETDLARASLTRVERRDPNVVYNLYTAESLVEARSRIRLGGVFRGAGNRAHFKSST